MSWAQLPPEKEQWAFHDIFDGLYALVLFEDVNTHTVTYMGPPLDTLLLQIHLQQRIRKEREDSAF